MGKKVLAAVCLSAALLLLIVAGPLAAKKVQPPSLTPIEQLGKELFFAKISSPGSMSCADCHDPKAGWTGPVAGINLHGAVYRGAIPQRFGNRKPPSSAYASFSPVFHYDAATGEFVGGNFWDGRATGETLESPTAEQALGPFLNPVEQNMPSAQAVCEQVVKLKLKARFEQVWGAGSLDCSDTGIDATYKNIGRSIAAYEASKEVNPFSSKFDLYWAACLAAENEKEVCGLALDEKDTLDPNGILTEQEFDGLIEFGEYCAPCHISHESGPGGEPPLFTDFKFDNIGVPKNPKNPFYQMDKVFLPDGSPINPQGAAYIDNGLGDFLRTRPEWNPMAEQNDGKFRTPTLRNVDLRPGNGFPKAYMHNGVFKSLEEVVHFYNTRDVPEKMWAPPEVDRNVNREIFEEVPLGNFQLDEEDEAAIVAFLKTLSDGYIR
jgi:cytochrome c peroxidase